MDNKELLKQRFEVIGTPKGTINYPGGWLQSGIILEQVEGMAEDVFGSIHKTIRLADITPFPHLFRRVDWWEYRKKEHLPKYVKCIKTPDQKIFPGDVLMINDWFMDGCGKTPDNQVVVLETNCFLPSDETEYKAIKLWPSERQLTSIINRFNEKEIKFKIWDRHSKLHSLLNQHVLVGLSAEPGDIDAVIEWLTTENTTATLSHGLSDKLTHYVNTIAWPHGAIKGIIEITHKQLA